MADEMAFSTLVLLYTDHSQLGKLQQGSLTASMLYGTRLSFNHFMYILKIDFHGFRDI